METKGEYLTEDQVAILARLMEVFTWGQLLQLAEKMAQVRANRFGGVEITVDKNQLRFRLMLSIAGGCVAWVKDQN